jgi:hypothetical protein
MWFFDFVKKTLVLKILRICKEHWVPGFWENFQNQRTSGCCWVLQILKEPTGFMKELAV